MATLAEIEAATETLSAQEREALIRFLAVRLGATGALAPKPRQEQTERRFDATAHRAWLERTWGGRRFTGEEVYELRTAQERGGA